MELDLRCEEVRQHRTRRTKDTIRENLPRLAMFHSEVMKAVLPLPRDILKLGVRRDDLDRAKLKLEQIKMRKRKRDE